MTNADHRRNWSTSDIWRLKDVIVWRRYLTLSAWLQHIVQVLTSPHQGNPSLHVAGTINTRITDVRTGSRCKYCIAPFFFLLCSLIFVTWCCYFLWISNRVFLKLWFRKEWLMCGKRKYYLFEVYKLIKYVPRAVFWWRTNQTHVYSMTQTDHAVYERCHCKTVWKK